MADRLDPLVHVVILDDDKSIADEFRESLSKCLSKRKISSIIDCVTNSSQLNERLENHPDIVICDISLKGNDDIMGLELIGNLKPKHPHVTFGAMTSNMEQLEKLDAIRDPPVFILPKTLILPEITPNFERAVIGAILRNVKQNRRFKTDIPQALEPSLKRVLDLSKFDRRIVECLIRQVFLATIDSDNLNAVNEEGELLYPDLGELLFPQVLDKVELSPFSEGGSGSAIFLAKTYVGKELQEVTVVLKFCHLDAYIAEVKNYERYVKWTLPHAWRVDMLGHGRTAKHGVIGYSLAFAGSAEAQTLSHHLQRGDAAIAHAFIARGFDPTSKVWYKNPRINSRDLGVDLTNRYFSEAIQRNAATRGTIDRVFKTNAGRSWAKQREGARNWLNSAVSTIVQRRRSSYQACICHGDLHGGNVMVAEGGERMAFIDFQDTGHHHVFTDLVFFENALRKDSSFPLYEGDDAFERERCAIAAYLTNVPATAPAPIGEGEVLVRRVRDAAAANFGAEPAEHYFVHLLLFTSKMMMQSTLADPVAERLALFFLACTEALESHYRETQP